MKFSLPMKVILGIAIALVVLRVITPSPEQQMMDQYNQQNQQMMDQLNQQNQSLQMQSMQMLNGMQDYSTPGYYQEVPNNPNGGYYPPQGNGGYYPQQGNGSYNPQQGNGGYPVDPAAYGPAQNTDDSDDWNW